MGLFCVRPWLMDIHSKVMVSLTNLPRICTQSQTCYDQLWPFNMGKINSF